MCAIVITRDKTKLPDMFVKNAYRGSIDHSLFTLKQRTSTQYDISCQARGQGRYLAGNELEGDLYIGHTHAPTTGEYFTSCIHPAEDQGAYLWHNGIIKQGELDHQAWDTMWVLKKINEEGFDCLSEIDGSFAGVYLSKEGKLFVFRNEIAPLFMNEYFDISSTKLDEFYKPIPPNKVFMMNSEMFIFNFEEVAQFKTKQNPYYFQEEV